VRRLAIFMAVTCNRKGAARRFVSLILNRPEHYGITRKATLLLSVLLAVVTSTVPVVAPIGTVVLMLVLDALNVAPAPLKVTLVAPFRLFPKIVTFLPTLPEVGFVSTNGLSPTDKLKSVPQPLGELQERSPPYVVVP
jgi:hypothetical protein